jgi:hypothetical protein
MVDYHYLLVKSKRAPHQPRLYGRGPQTNSLDYSEWHSSITWLVLRGRVIWREANYVAVAERNHISRLYDVQFCPHHDASSLSGILAPLTNKLFWTNLTVF